mgnify:FL=1
MEVRCRIVHALRNTLSLGTTPYLLDQEVREPDPQILSLNLELVIYDETISKYLRDKEVSFIRTGLGMLITRYLVGNAPLASPMNANGSGRMQLNILVLQQNLKNVEEGVDLARAANFFALFDKGSDAIIKTAKGSDKTYTEEELKTLVQLCFSEQLSNRERGLAVAAKRQLADKLEEF